MRKLFPALLFCLVLGWTLPCLSAGDDLGALSLEELAERATVDTLYYEFDKWVPEFKKRIHRLESQTQTVHTQIALMKHYF